MTSTTCIFTDHMEREVEIELHTEGPYNEINCYLSVSPTDAEAEEEGGEYPRYLSLDLDGLENLGSLLLRLARAHRKASSVSA